MRPAQIVTAAGEIGIPITAALDMRMRYLFGLMEGWKEFISGRTSEIPALTYPAIQKQIEALHRYESDPNPKGKITDDMIATAKEYPIEKVIDFDKRGNAMAFCHVDKNPSLSWYKAANKAHCWSCSRSFDTIEVLRQRDGMSFISAVKELQ